MVVPTRRERERERDIFGRSGTATATCMYITSRYNISAHISAPARPHTHLGFLPPSLPLPRPPCFPWRIILRGQGCNQAIACAKLLSSSSGGGGGSGPSSSPPPPSAAAVSFLGQFGNDAASSDLRRALTSSGVRISPRSGTSRVHPSGRGYVMVVPGTGEVCAVVSGGSNLYGWGRWGGGGGGAEEEEEEKTTRRRRR